MQNNFIKMCLINYSITEKHGTACAVARQTVLDDSIMFFFFFICIISVYPDVLLYIFYFRKKTQLDHCYLGINVSIQFLKVFFCVCSLGGCECSYWSNPIHNECASGLSYILANFQHYGSKSVCWQVLLLC